MKTGPKRMNFARLWLLAGSLYPASAVHAQHPLILERLAAWNEAAPQPSDEILLGQVRSAVEEIYPASETCAATNVELEKAQPASADRFAFNALIRGTMRNAWFVTVRAPGCDGARVRFMVMQNADESFETIRVNRGESHAWESLISDTMPLVTMGAMGHFIRQGHECSPDSVASLGVTRIASEEANLGDDVYGIRYTGSWAEIWPIKMCGKTIEMQINFNADGDGGAYTNIPGDKIRIVR